MPPIYIHRLILSFSGIGVARNVVLDFTVVMARNMVLGFIHIVARRMVLGFTHIVARNPHAYLII